MWFSLKAKMHKSIPERSQDARLGFACCALLTLVGSLSAWVGRAEAGTFKAGLANIDISTRLQLPMGGYGTFFLKTPRLNGAGIHDPLYAGALVVESSLGEVAALVSVDAVGLSGAQVSRIEAKVREIVDPKIHLIVAATHTHHSPDTLGLWGSLPRSGRNSRYSEQLETAIIQAVRDAYAIRTEAKVTQKTGRHANDSTNSASPEDIQDQFVSLSFHAENDGRLLGTLTQWAAHPTILGMENNALSADFIGAFRESMYRTEPATHLYFNGAIGKVYPLNPGTHDADLIDDLFPNGDRDIDVKDSYQRVSTVGHRLAEAVRNAPLKSLKFLQEPMMGMCHVPVLFPVDNSLFKLASNLRVVETRIKNKHIRSRISSLTLGDISFVSIPGEAFPKLLSKLSADRLVGRQPIWLGMGQDWLGYFVDEADYQNPKLKYWTDLSVHKDASKILLDGIGNALAAKECAEWTDEEE
jgi:hypothetical protein